MANIAEAKEEIKVNSPIKESNVAKADVEEKKKPSPSIKDQKDDDDAVDPAAREMIDTAE